MPHRCVHCSAVYSDGSEEILKGCSCGSRFFFYITQEKLDKLNESKDDEIDLNNSEKKQIEKDVREIVGAEDDETPIVLDFESIKILKPGKYLLDLHNLFNRERPLVYKLEDGKYIIDLTTTLEKD
ncbi:hypothetical protein COU60_03220 [Candidatus Pacearchaeota archaeon CG10_big_fil_rev_8_21_14_0_10_34_76]|nr:MAG: hypothetical protein COU60_03220 [Candidatus Pacearchaeota archaeon CG10_big_fil_rev_8_21_14_0_10_34_76]